MLTSIVNKSLVCIDEVFSDVVHHFTRIIYRNKLNIDRSYLDALTELLKYLDKGIYFYILNYYELGANYSTMDGTMQAGLCFILLNFIIWHNNLSGSEKIKFTYTLIISICLFLKF